MMTGILRFPSIMHMTDLNRALLDKYIRSVGVRQIRLACGLVLFAYLLSHFINHALGNISMDALATGVRYHTVSGKVCQSRRYFMPRQPPMPASGSGRFTSAVNFTGKRSSRYNLY